MPKISVVLASTYIVFFAASSSASVTLNEIRAGGFDAGWYEHDFLEAVYSGNMVHPESKFIVKTRPDDFFKSTNLATVHEDKSKDKRGFLDGHRNHKAPPCPPDCDDNLD